MIHNNDNSKSTLKQMREKEQKERQDRIKSLCEEYAKTNYGEEQITKWEKQHKAVWYLSVLNEDETAILKLAIMRPIDRHILSHASTKLTDDGLYTFLETCMRECWIEGDQEIVDNDEYFIPAAQTFNSMIESKKVAFVKR